MKIWQKIGLICTDLSEDKFGSTITPLTFESVVMGVLDEPGAMIAWIIF